MTAAVQRVDDICALNGLGPERLPSRSAQAYRGLLVLAGDGGGARYVAARGRALGILRAAVARHKPHERRPLELRFRNAPTYWRWRARRDRIDVDLSDVFLTAPDEIFSELADWCLQRDVRRARRAAEGWVAAEGNAPPPLGPGAGRGVVHDLEELFRELNAELFAGALERPRLRWSDAPTFHKFGHYSYADDEVLLSSSLDQLPVSRRVVAYVLYHELLHKQLGVGSSGLGRRRTHSREFLARERRFPGYSAAVAELDGLARKWRRRR